MEHEAFRITVSRKDGGRGEGESQAPKGFPLLTIPTFNVVELATLGIYEAARQ